MSNFYWKLKLSGKIALLGGCSVLLTVIILVGLAVWQSNQFNSLAQEDVNFLINSDLDNITQGIYNLVQTEDQAVQQQISNNLHVAKNILDKNGEVSLSSETITWLATNQFTNETREIELPKLLINNQWININFASSVTTPVVDEVVDLIGDTATLFQRINSDGDMLRVATTVKSENGQRAIGTYIPAINPDGTPNQVISTVLNGDMFLGRAYVVNDWYLTAYQPIYDHSTNLIGMLYVGMKLDHLEDRVRKAIINTKVGNTGYVFILQGTGSNRGEYIISKDGLRDGENIWDSKDYSGEYFIQSMLNKALVLQPGQMDSIRYPWQNIGETEPRWKIAKLAYYEPWDWVIGTSAYEDELQVYKTILSDGRKSMTVILSIAGVILSLLIGFIGIIVARSISFPIQQMTNAVKTITQGDLTQVIETKSKDEVGVLASSFNKMTTQLRETLIELQISEERLTKAQQIAQLGNWELDFSNEELIWSAEMYRIFEIDQSNQKIPHQLIYDLIHPDDIEMVKKTHIESRSQKSLIEIDYRLLLPDKRIKYLHERYETYFNDQGIPIRKIGTTQDISNQKKIELINRELLSMLESTLEATDNGILVISESNRIVHTNRRFTQMWSIAEKDIINNSEQSFVDYAKTKLVDSNEFLTLVDQLKKSPETEVFEIISFKDGQIFEIASLPMLNNLIPIGRVWSFRDITERKKAEESLQNERSLLENIMETSPVGITKVNNKGDIIYANSRATQILGLTKDQISQRTYNAPQWQITDFSGNVFPDKELPFNRVLDSKKPVYDVQHAIQWPDGKKVLLSINAAPIFNPKGKFDGMVASIEDITEIKKVEVELKERQRERETLLMNLPGLAYRCNNDKNYTMEFVSKGCFDLTGYEPDDLINNSLIAYSDLVHPEDRDRIWNDIQIALENNDSYTLTYRIRNKQGEIRWVWEQGMGVVSSSNNKFYLEGYITDITNIKSTEEALEKRIIALTRPLDDSRSIVFEELFNLDEIQKLQDDFSTATGVASIITHVDGTPITKPSNFCRLCQDIIRKSEKGLINCYKSDAEIGRLNTNGPIIQPCLSGGLWDSGAGITVGGKHIANWLIGQVRDKTQSEDRIRAYAKEIDVDESLVIEAFREVPSMSREQFNNVSTALFTLANQLSAIAYQNIQQAQFISESKKAENLLLQNAERVETLLILNQMTDATLQQITDFALEKAVRLTQSKIGYLAFLNEDETILSMFSWSKNIIQDSSFADSPTDLEVANSGLWGEAIRQRKPIITNDYDAPNPYKKGFPAGHVKVTRHMNIPVFVGNHIVLVAGVGNKNDEYDENDVKQLTLLMEGMWHLVERIRVEEQLKQYRDHLEEQVADRTKELLSINQELETFSYSVSHDLRAHLRAMSGYSKILLEDASDKLDETYSQYLTNIVTASDQMNNLIDDLISLSHVSHTEMQIESVDLSEMVQSILENYHNNQPDRKVDFDIQNGILVQGSKGLLNIALENLLSNAWKFTSKKQTAKINFSEDIINHERVFIIRDNGAGFEMKHAEKLFKPFQRLHTTSEFPGTGIGLSIVQRIIERHGGKIWVKADKNKGAAFYFTL